MLPPFIANGRLYFSSAIILRYSVRMSDNEKDHNSVHKKDTSGHKRKASDNSRAKGTPEHIEANVVVENGAIIGASAPQGEVSSPALLTAIQEGFTQMSGSMANAIAEAFKSFKADLEIPYDEEIQEEDLRFRLRGRTPREEEARRCE